MNCHQCATNGIERAASARCRICFVTLCSPHLSDAMHTVRSERRFACGHVFVATGWLANALRRESAYQTIAASA
jgi:hypothetical protein